MKTACRSTRGWISGGRINTGSVYATDTLSFGNAWNVVLSGRYNRTSIDNRDRIRPVAGPGSLTGEHVFDRFNPAAGVTFRATGWLNVFAGYSEGSRAPTSIELGCADPEQPCKLPNAMAGDPPLQQVVTRTFEAGVRGGWNGTEMEPRRGSVRTIATIFCSSRRNRPASVISRTSARRCGRGSKSI